MQGEKIPYFADIELEDFNTNVEESTDEGGDPYEDDENEAAASRESVPELTDREEMEENGDETEK